MSALETDRNDETKTPAARRTRGGTSYQHSLSARGIKSSGRARSRTDEDLLSSLKRLERAASRPLEDEDRGRSRAFGRNGETGEGGRAAGNPGEKRVRGPRLDW